MVAFGWLFDDYGFGVCGCGYVLELVVGWDESFYAYDSPSCEVALQVEFEDIFIIGEVELLREEDVDDCGRSTETDGEDSVCRPEVIISEPACCIGVDFVEYYFECSIACGRGEDDCGLVLDWVLGGCECEGIGHDPGDGREIDGVYGGVFGVGRNVDI